MAINVVIATITYFVIGFSFFIIVDGNKNKNNTAYYVVTFIVGLFFCLLYYYGWILMDLENYRGIEGLFSRDSATYYTQAVQIAKSSFSSDVLGPIITDHYHQILLAVQIFIFGEHVLIPKIYQVLLFSIGVVLWVNIAKDILNDTKLVNYFFCLLLFCVPLLTYNAHVLKEMSLFFFTAVAIYGFTKYHYYGYKGSLWLILFGIIFMFVFRSEYAVVMLFAFFISTFISSSVKQRNKVLLTVVSIVIFLLVSSLPVFQTIEATYILTEGGSVFVSRGETGRVAAFGSGGLIGNAIFLISNPSIVLPMFLYGVLMLFFHPPFFHYPSYLLYAGNLDYLTMGYYNAFFILLFPALFFGACHLYKDRKGDPVLIAILIYVVLVALGAIFSSDSYRRFKISYFWPVVYIYTCYGIATYSKWRKFLPMVIIVFLGLLLMYFSVDLIGFVTY